MNIPSFYAPSEIVQIENLKQVNQDVVTLSLYGSGIELEYLRNLKSLSTLWLSGLDKKSWHHLSGLNQIRKLIIFDWSLEDLQLLAGWNLDYLAINGGSKLKSLKGIENQKKIHTLILFNCCNFENLDQLSGLENLVTLCLEGGFSKDLKVNTLEPLKSLVSLKHLRLASIRIKNRSLKPLHSLKALEDIFVAKVFGKKEHEELADALPAAHMDWMKYLLMKNEVVSLL
jgi:hypothetical protein